MVPRTSSHQIRTILVLLTAASLLGWLPRSRRMTTLRRHVELLQRVTPIHQFAPAYAQRAAFDPTDRLDLTIVAHRVRLGAPYLLVPVDDRQLAAWLT